MNLITKEFMTKTRIPETPNHTVEKIMDYLSSKEAVNAMIVMSKLGQPALAGVVKQLEKDFARSDFPLTTDGPGANAANRRAVGWMIKFVMGKFGYVPMKCESSDMYLKKFAGAEYFKSSAVYEPVTDGSIADYKLEYTIISQCPMPE